MMLNSTQGDSLRYGMICGEKSLKRKNGCYKFGCPGHGIYMRLLHLRIAV